jgi:hypothetical protein
LLQNFGEAAVVEPLTLVESPPPGLEQLHVVEGRKDKRKTAAIHLERVDHRGGLAGWAYADPAPADGAINVAIDIDGEPQDTVPAERFRPDLLKLGFGTGECGFNFMIPLKYLDGQRHLITAVGIKQETPFATEARPFDLPRHFVQSSRPWRAADNRGAFLRIKNKIITHGIDDDILAELRAATGDNPSLVFHDAGIAEWFRRAGRRFPTFRERLVDRMATTRLPLIATFNSKSATKDYCTKHGIRIPATIGVFDNIEAIRSAALPDRFAVKPSAGSGVHNHIYVEGVDLLTRRRTTIDQILDDLAGYAAEQPGMQFVVEEVVQPRGVSQPAIPPDYKLHVFGGRVRLIHVDDRNVFLSRDPLHRQQGWFSADWQPAPFRIRVREEEAIDFARPETLAEMIALAERIGSDVGDYVRVDLYDGEAGIVLGEVTTFSHGGIGFTEYGDFILSQAWFVSPALASPRERSPSGGGAL